MTSFVSNFTVAKPRPLRTKKKVRASSLSLNNTSTSAPKTATENISPSVEETVNAAQNLLTQMEEKNQAQKSAEQNEMLSQLNEKIETAKNSCIGIKADLKGIQVLAGVSTGASSVGTLTSGGALASGIVKSVKDKKIDEFNIEGKKKRLAEVNTLLETKDENIKEYNKLLYGREGLLSKLNNNKFFEEGYKNTFESEYQHYLSEVRYYAESRQKAIKEVPKLYKQYNTKQIEYENCLDKLHNNEEYKKLEERDYELIDIAYQRNKEKDLNNRIPLKKENIINMEELTKEEKKEWQDIQYKKVNFEMECDNLRFEREDIYYQMNELDEQYKDAARMLKKLGFRVGYQNVEHNIRNSSLLEEVLNVKSDNYEFEKETFNDVDSYIKQYRETGNKFSEFDTDDSMAKYYYMQYKNSSSFSNKTQMEIDKVMAKIKEFEDLEKEKELLEKEISDYNKNKAVSNFTGNLRTGLLAGSIATSATSTITSGISIKKLDDLVSKMKSCDKAVEQVKAQTSFVKSELEEDDISNNSTLSKADEIVKSCSGFDTGNIKDIKGVMTASTITAGVGTVAGTVGTITSAVANTKNVREDTSDDGKVKAKGLNLTANISAGITTATSGAGIVLGAVSLNKLAKNVDTAEKCEDALK